MVKKYFAKVESLSSTIEEQVTLTLNDLEITCFAGVCPYQIDEGFIYPVLFAATIFDDYEVEKSESNIMGLERIGGSFSYWANGLLSEGVIDCGIQFEDEILQSDYGYLDGQFIRMKVDRLDVEFLEK